MTLDQSARLATRVGWVAVMCVLCARADTILVGALSYDTFIPELAGASGVDAFNVANLTGSFSLPPDFPAAANLTFQNASLTLNLIGQVPERFNLGDIEPGFLLDSSGNPVIQAPSSQGIASAEFTATLSAQVFALADGTSFTAGSTAIDVLLLPSQGQSLTADIDQTTLDVSSASPEPASWALTLLVLVSVVCRRWLL